MKSLLTIFLVLFSAVAVQAGAESRSCVLPSAPYAVLSQGDDWMWDSTDTPLFATVVQSVSSQLSSSEAGPVKSRSTHNSYAIVWMRDGQRRMEVLLSQEPTLPHKAPLTSARAVDYYIYMLRRIVI